MPNLYDLTVDFVSLVDRAAVRDSVQQNEPARFLFYKRDTDTPEKGALMPRTLDELTAELAKSEEARAAAAADLEKAKTDIDELTRQLADSRRDPARKADAEEIDKSELPPAVRAALDKAEADRDAAKAEVAKAQEDAKEAGEIAKAERDARLTREYIAKAETLTALPIKKDEFGPVLKAAAEKLTKDEFDAIDTVLKAANEQIAKGDLFKSLGANGDGPKLEGAKATATAKAAELRKADPKLTEAAAMQQVFKADPELAAAYQDEVRAA